MASSAPPAHRPPAAAADDPLLEGLRALAERSLGAGAGAGVTLLKGDGSDRRVYRVRTPGGATAVGVTNPWVAENRAFAHLSRVFRAEGLPVPEILAEDSDGVRLLLEDLGDSPLADELDRWNAEAGGRARVEAAYRRALDWLPRFQVVAHRKLDYSFCYMGAAMDVEGCRRDTQYFLDHFCGLFLPREPVPGPALADLARLAERVGGSPADSFVYRDFQSRNIMWRDGGPWFIDYQSGCRGAVFYDPASMLYASRAGVDDEQRGALMEHYRLALGATDPARAMGAEEFRERFFQFVLIRRIRSLGTYGYLPSQKGKAGFLGGIPGTLAEVRGLLEREPALEDYAGLRALFRDWAARPDLLSLEWLSRVALRGPAPGAAAG